MRRIPLLLFLLTSALAFASPHAPSTSNWIAADFDGDHQTDFASTRRTGHSERGYAHEVHLGLSGSEHSSFTFSTPSARVQLRIQDIDGDHDHDIVILEKWSQKPIGIWLNDGSGHFREGDLADYEDALRTPGHVSIRNPPDTYKPSLDYPEEHSQPGHLSPRIVRAEPVYQSSFSEVVYSFEHSRRSRFRVRAPPQQS